MNFISSVANIAFRNSTPCRSSSNRSSPSVLAQHGNSGSKTLSICDTAKEFCLDDFVTVTKNDSFIICGRTENSKSEWILSASDGNNVWKLILTKHKLESLIAFKEIQIQQYLSEFKNHLDADKLQINRSNDVKLFTDDNKINLTLKPVDKNMKSRELSSLLFHLADRIKTLTITKQVRKPMKRQSDQRGFYDQPLMDLEGHKKKGPINFQHRQGLSPINPYSKKPKMSRGVNFE